MIEVHVTVTLYGKFGTEIQMRRNGNVSNYGEQNRNEPARVRAYVL